MGEKFIYFRAGGRRMFHLFHKPLLKLAREAAGKLRNGNTGEGFALCDQLAEELNDLHLIHEHELYRKVVVRSYGGLWEELDDAAARFEELLPHIAQFSRAVGEAEHTHQYRPLAAALDDVTRELEWFEGHEAALREACGDALHEVAGELKEIEHVRRLIERVE